MLPHDFPPWEAVYQQTQRWIAAGVFEAMVHDLLRELLRLAQGRAPEPTAAILDSRTLRSTPESGHRGGYDGAKRKKGSKLHAAADTLGHLLALRVTPAAGQDRAQVEALAEAVQEATGESVELAYVDRGYAGEEAAERAEANGIRSEVVKHPGAKKGFVLLPRRWVVEMSQPQCRRTCSFPDRPGSRATPLFMYCPARSPAGPSSERRNPANSGGRGGPSAGNVAA
jgi:transposase